MTGDPKSDPNENLDPEIAAAMEAAEEAVTTLRGDEASPEDAEADIELEVVEAAPNADQAARIEELERELAAAKDRWLRAVADHENFKKRQKRELEEALNRNLQKTLGDMLPVGDNLDRALEAADPEDQVATGIRMVRSVFDSALARQGIVPINALGTVFDPAVHDALQQVDSPDHAPGVVMQVFERGYMRDGKLFRPARVIVAGPGSTGEPPPATEEDPGDDSADNTEN